MISVRLASELSRKYSIAKANYFYGKTKEDVKEWLAEIDQMIEANNVTVGKRVAVATAHLRNAVTD